MGRRRELGVGGSEEGSGIEGCEEGRGDEGAEGGWEGKEVPFFMRLRVEAGVSRALQSIANCKLIEREVRSPAIA
jgi:hypothetical protein